MNSAETLAFAEHFVMSIQRGDADAVRACYAPGAKIWHNTDNVEQTVDKNIELVKWLHRTLKNVNYRVVRRVALDNGFLQTHVLEGTRADGSRFKLDACVIITMEKGLITRLDEYIDSAQTIAATSRPAAPSA
jgi:ketosteroid isomerase-like protein